MNNTNIYNINFELDIYRAMLKCPFKINSKQVNLKPINKLEDNYLIDKNKKNHFDYNFEYKKVITKNIYDKKTEYEKEKNNINYQILYKKINYFIYL